MICTQPWATKRLGRMSGKIIVATVLRASPLDSQGALHRYVGRENPRGPIFTQDERIAGRAEHKILGQIRTHQTANHNYLEEGIRLLELANKAYSLYLRQPALEKARLLKIAQSNCL
jgi:hypothetical protein